MAQGCKALMTAIAGTNTKFPEKLLQFSRKPDSILRLLKKTFIERIISGMERYDSYTNITT
jgi:hypothetical protein